MVDPTIVFGAGAILSFLGIMTVYRVDREITLSIASLVASALGSIAMMIILRDGKSKTSDKG